MRQKQGVFSLFLLSPSSRRAWIEIAPPSAVAVRPCVALLAEGVERNGLLATVRLLSGCRPPRGGRG